MWLELFDQINNKLGKTLKSNFKLIKRWRIKLKKKINIQKEKNINYKLKKKRSQVARVNPSNLWVRLWDRDNPTKSKIKKITFFLKKNDVECWIMRWKKIRKIAFISKKKRLEPTRVNSSYPRLRSWNWNNPTAKGKWWKSQTLFF
jgi:hypothetical protein